MITKTAYRIYADSFKDIPFKEKCNYFDLDPASVTDEEFNTSSDFSDADRADVLKRYNYDNNAYNFYKKYPYLANNGYGLMEAYPKLFDSAITTGNLDTTRNPDYKEKYEASPAMYLGALAGAGIGSVIPKVNHLVGAGLGALAGGTLGEVASLPFKKKDPNSPDELVARLQAEYDKNAW